MNFIMTNDGTISLVANNKAHTVYRDHPNYNAILSRIKARSFEGIEHLMDIGASITSNFKSITIQDGVVYFNGKPLHNVVTQKIMQFIREGIPFEPLVAFLNNLLQNPSFSSVQELYSFLEVNGIPITEDGCFLAFKGVCRDYKDKHTGTFDNSVGQKPRMERNRVDDDRNKACSDGLHAGTYEYAADFAGSDGRLMLVKINPAHVVSVPLDCSCQKLRTETYEVIEECVNKQKVFSYRSY